MLKNSNKRAHISFYARGDGNSGTYGRRVPLDSHKYLNLDIFSAKEVTN
uniref:Uncharacterized protein n=1 Tax=Setaria italica TaxID=4555 RepID=K3XU99_SETIT